MIKKNDKHLRSRFRERLVMVSLCAGLLMQYGPAVAAQGGYPVDTMAVFRAFISVCQSYQRLPLQLQMEVHRYTNLMTSGEDTVSQQADFYLDRQAACIRMGDMEQLSGDSVMVIVSNKLKRILVYHNIGTVTSLLARFVAGPLKDSSLTTLARRYQAGMTGGEGDTSQLLLRDRQYIYGTQLPKEEIRAFYNRISQAPYKVVQLQRKLVMIDPEAWKDFSGKPGWEGMLVKGTDGTCYLVKELRTEFCYRHIGHDAGEKQPVLLSDPIIATGPGSWKAARGYEDFIISEP